MNIFHVPIILNCIRHKNYVIPIQADYKYIFFLLKSARLNKASIEYQIGKNGSFRTKRIRNKDKVLFDFNNKVNKTKTEECSYIILPTKQPLYEPLCNVVFTFDIPYIFSNNKYMIKTSTYSFDIYPHLNIHQTINFDKLFHINTDRKNESIPYFGNIYINNKYIPYNEALEQFIRTIDAYTYDSTEGIISLINKCLFLKYEIINNKLVEVVESDYYINIVSTTFTSERKYNPFIPVYDKTIIDNCNRFAKLIS
ncbi:MAG: hypothetical protein QXF12_05370 [Candidatus Aenigmatarchaeota archaeon]